ncbi:hypothetical protein ABL78_0825 [Leptomonas seymouri]|uniref:Uncharacterized protein n=1 Tax=Leptomonas seymouri TaxID=5684 RepID=A0A0N1IBH5_LEPSE|nr:hypothetical protein ABL78_0825 [Leptomonas seymouri]|eukprot:KPI90072.1 hypothetical protein ABL78_0825 [Leptomonas seymouri]
MSQASNAEALLFGLLGSEANGALPCQSKHQTDALSLQDVCAGLGSDTAAVKHKSQRDVCGSLESERVPVERFGGTLAPMLEPSWGSFSSSAHSIARRCEAATPSKKRERCSSSLSGLVSEECTSSRTSSEAGKAETPVRATGIPESLVSLSSSASPSSQPVLSLSHPVVEFLSSVQMQGYAAHIIEDLGLRTMPALLSRVRSEADVIVLLGPYASLQQQSELWKGLRRWEKEEARRTKAEAEERRRQQLANARAQRIKHRRPTKKAETQQEANHADVQRGGTIGQQPWSHFPQLEKENFFSLPRICNCTPEEVASASLANSAIPPRCVASCETVSGMEEQDCVADASSAAPQQPPTRLLSDSSPSYVSLTTRATQLMRKLSHRCTRSCHTRRCRRGGCCGNGLDSDPPGGQARGKEIEATALAVPYDVDAETEVLDDSGEDEVVSGKGVAEVYGNAAMEGNCSPTSSSPSRSGDEEGSQLEVLSRTPSPSSLSSESHLSSLFSSLRERHRDGQWEHRSQQGYNEANPQLPGNAGKVSATALNGAENVSLSARMHHENASIDSLSRAADVACSVHNELVAAHHVSLGALSAHAELEQVPLETLRPPHVFFNSSERGCERDAPVVEAEAQEPFSPAVVDEDLVADGANVAVPDNCVCMADNSLAPALNTVNRVSEARERLERRLLLALLTYNDEIAATLREAAASRADGISGDESRDDTLKSLTPMCAVLYPLSDVALEAQPSSVVAASRRGALKSAQLVHWAPAPSSDRDSVAPKVTILSPLRVANEGDEAFRASLQPASDDTTHAETQPPRPAPSAGVRSSYPFSLSVPPDTYSSLPLSSSEQASTADVVLSAFSSVAVSASSTARPTAVPNAAFGLHNVNAGSVDGESTNVIEAPLIGATVPHVPQQQGLSQQPGRESMSRSESVAQLTADTQGVRLNVASCEELHLHATSRGSSRNGLAGFALGNDTGGVLGCGGNGSQRVGRSDERQLCSADCVWVEEEVEADGCLIPAGSQEISGHRATCDRERGVEAESQHDNSQDWWDSYGIDALNYTQNCLDDVPIPTQKDGRSDGVSACERGTSPAAKPTAQLKRSHEASPPPTEVVEVTSGDEAEAEALQESFPQRSRSATTARAACGIDRLQPTSNSVHALHTDTNNSNSSTSSPSLMPHNPVDPRLQPSVWRFMSNEELWGLCQEFGLSVRPTARTPPAGLTLRRSSPRFPSSSPSMPQGVRSSTPEWVASHDLESPETAADGEAARVSPRSLRELCQRHATVATPSLPPTQPVLATQQDLRSALCHRGEGEDFDRAAEETSEAAASQRGHGGHARRVDGRVARMEREALLESLQLLTVRLQFCQRVAPFFLHRVEHFSGLPYKRLRTADLVDEGSVLTRDDLQQARQRYKVEEQAEIERCVLSALAAEAVEATERYAQQHLTPTAGDPGEGDGDGSKLHNGAASSGSPLHLASATVSVLSCYENILLREPVNMEAAAAAVQKCFPHVAYTRVQQLLTLNEVIAKVVAETPRRSPSPPPPSTSTPTATASSCWGTPTDRAAADTPAQPVVPSPTLTASQSQGASLLSQETLRRANARRYFAQRGYMTRSGAWGQGGRRRRGGCG